MAHTIYFISHPEVDIQPDIPVPEWSLSAEGAQRMRQALALPWISTISAVYSSTEKKAIDGAEILAQHLDLSVTQIPELGENDRSSTGFLPPDEFETMANRFFAAPLTSVEGWERAIDAQGRITTVVRQIDIRDQSSGSIAIVSHGGVGTLLFCSMANKPIDRGYDQPAQGNYLELQFLPLPKCEWWRPLV